MAVLGRVALFLALLFLGLFVSHNSVHAQITATFELKSGVIYEKVAYYIDSRYGIVELTLPEGKRKVSIADIAEVRDPTGNDVTLEVIGRESSKKGAVPSTPQASPAEQTVAPAPASPPAQEEQWQSEGSEKYRRWNRSPWIMALKLGPVYSFPIGNFYKGFSSSVGFDGSLFFAVSRRIALGGHVVMAGVGVDERELLEAVGLRGAVVVSNDLNPSIVSLSAEVMAHSPLSRQRRDKGYWYITTGLGATRLSSTGMVVASYAGDLYGVGAEKTTKFMIPSSLGVVYQFAPNIGLDAGVTFNYSWVGSGEPGAAPQAAALLHFGAGLTFIIPSADKH